MKNNEYNYQDVANYIIEYCDDQNYSLTNLRLQKLMYFVQAFAYSKIGRYAISDDFEAWAYGPVIPDLYREYSHNGSAQIKSDQIKEHYDAKVRYDKEKKGFHFNFINSKRIDINLQKVVKEVIETFADKNDFYLVRLSHEIGPWKNYYESGRRNILIPKNEIGLIFGGTSVE